MPWRDEGPCALHGGRTAALALLYASTMGCRAFVPDGVPLSIVGRLDAAAGPVREHGGCIAVSAREHNYRPCWARAKPTWQTVDVPCMYRC